jgi:hypothetical protein
MPPKKIPRKTSTGRTPLNKGTIPEPAKTGYKGTVNYSPKSSPRIEDTEMPDALPLKTSNKSNKNSSGNHAKPMDIPGGNTNKKRNNKN